MDHFLEIIVSFPTVVFTVLLIFGVFYWALAVLGLVDIEILDFSGAEFSADSDTFSTLEVMSGLLTKLGLNGVPLTIVISLIALFGWAISFVAVFFVMPIIPTALLKFIVGVPILIAASYCAAIVTSWLIRPLRPIFLASNQEHQTSILGKPAIVRTGVVDNTFGEALVDDGGAGLIVKVRSFQEQTFQRGERVVLIEYVSTENIYRVISEADFSA